MVTELLLAMTSGLLHTEDKNEMLHVVTVPGVTVVVERVRMTRFLKQHIDIL